jgi:hypothetical protein
MYKWARLELEACRVTGPGLNSSDELLTPAAHCYCK